MSNPVVQMTGVTKRFPGVLANDQVDLDLREGEVLALLGENGAGKTTLMNILYGLYTADAGSIRVRGVVAQIRSPRDSISLGISMVHQQFELIDTLTVSENVALGLRSIREPFLELQGVSQKVSELSSRYGLKVDTGALVGQLSAGERQRVEILKALYRGSKILILDEPTSVLTPQEAEDLFSLVRSMAKEGSSVVIITHKLPEVLAVSDRVTVLRKGRVAGTVQTASTNAADLAIMMVGHEVSAGTWTPSDAKSEAVLELRNVHAFNRKGSMGLKGLSLELRSGEVLGIAGVAGNGQNELVEVLLGLCEVEKGQVIIKGKEMTNSAPSELIDAGVGVVPEDRKGAGLIPEFSLAENLVLEKRWSKDFSRRGLLDHGRIVSHASELVKEFSIMTPDVSSPAYTLSGGNLQKLILARVLSRHPSILVAAQPTAGLDVGATQFIWERLRSERDKGVGVLLISSDLGEVTALSDRVACIYDGAIVGVMRASEADTKKLGLLIGGVVAS